MIGCRGHVVTVFCVMFVIGIVFVESASGQNVKDCVADQTCTGDPKKTTITVTTTMDPKKAKTTTTTMDPRKFTTTMTIDPKKATTTTTTTTTTTMNKKKITMNTTTTAKDTLKTQVVTSPGDGEVLRHYNISGRDSDYRSADLKQIVVLDVPVIADTDNTVNGSGNASISAPSAVGGIKPDANKVTEMTSPTNVTTKIPATTFINNSISTNTTTSTTESTRVSQPNTGFQVVRFVDHIYCDCDLIVSN